MSELNSLVDSAVKRHGVITHEDILGIVHSIENKLSFIPSLNIKYKDAKKEFKKSYFTELLTFSLGNISKASETANLNRRHIHRICTSLKINTDSIRAEMIKPYNYLKDSLKDVIEKKFEDYKKDNKHFEKIYKNLPKISENIAGDIQIKIPSYEDALNSFEKAYFENLLKTTKDLESAKIKSGVSVRQIQRKIAELSLN